MIRINIHEAKTHLSRYLAELAKGETIVICNRNVPVAEIRPLAAPLKTKRPIGLARGLVVPPSFFEPLPDEEIGGFGRAAMKLLLDTCTFLWAIAGAADLSVRARQLIEDPGNEVFLSAASSWEIALKHALGRLPLPAPPAQFVPDQRERHAIEALPIDEEAALHVGRLPALHKDPFDRMLVCQSIVHGLTILGPDPLIAQYPVRTLW